MHSSESGSYPLVSVIVPMYNSEDYIERTARSVLDQSYPNIEVLCVDDFSDDSTTSVVADLAESDPRLRLLRNDSKGANSARMKGVLAAGGELIMFLDSDDEIIEGAICYLVDLLLSNRVDMVCANIVYSERGRESVRFHYPSPGFAINLEKAPRAVLDVKPSACAKLFRSHLFEGMKFIDVPFAQDWNISYKTLANAHSLLFSNEPVYRYLIRRNSTSTRKSDLTLRELLAVLRCLEDILSYRGVAGVGRIRTQEAAVVASRFIFNMLGRSFHLDRKNRYEALPYLRRSLSAAMSSTRFWSMLWRDRGRGVILMLSLSCWPAYELVRIYWFRSRGSS